MIKLLDINLKSKVQLIMTSIKHWFIQRRSVPNVNGIQCPRKTKCIVPTPQIMISNCFKSNCRVSFLPFKLFFPRYRTCVPVNLCDIKATKAAINIINSHEAILFSSHHSCREISSIDLKLQDTWQCLDKVYLSTNLQCSHPPDNNLWILKMRLHSKSVSLLKETWQLDQSITYHGNLQT